MRFSSRRLPSPLTEIVTFLLLSISAMDLVMISARHGLSVFYSPLFAFLLISHEHLRFILYYCSIYLNKIHTNVVTTSRPTSEYGLSTVTGRHVATRRRCKAHKT